MGVPVEDERKVFETNFWGTVHGTKTAVEHLRLRGGAIVNVGSVASDRAIPLQAAYSASKQAIKAYTEALRVELEEQGIPISVTLIKPTSIHTPFFEHAKNYMDAEPRGPAPVYAPETVAEAILYAAENPVRDLLVGDSATVFSAMGRWAPRLGDKYSKATMFRQQKSSRKPKPEDHQSLERPSGTLNERGQDDMMALPVSPYTKAAMHPRLMKALAAGAVLTVGATLLRRR
jgi:short-subunit dehydrogenase